MTPAVRLSGGCHCGAVQFQVDVPAELVISDCNCSICAMSGFLHLIVTADAFHLERGADQLIEYRFNTGTARHLFCRTCGVKSFYVPRSHPDGYSVNWRAIDDTTGVTATIVAYDGANWEAARATLAG